MFRIMPARILKDISGRAEYRLRGRIKMPSIKGIILKSFKKIITRTETTSTSHPSDAQALWSEYVFYSPLESTTWTGDLE